MSEKKDKCCHGHKKGSHGKDSQKKCDHENMSQSELLNHLKECLNCSLGKLECIRDSLDKISIQ